jgi:hypothetical protein
MIVCLLSLGAFTLDFYITQLLSLYNSSNQLLSLYNSTSWLQRLYHANFIYLNFSLISTWTPTRLGLRSWTLSWLNFFLNSVFKPNRILWSFSWLRLPDLDQLELLIFILLGLDLNRVLYVGIFLGSNSFNSPPSTRIDLFIWLRINFISLLNRSCINMMFPCIKRSLTQTKEVSLSCMFLSCSAPLPEFLPSRVTPYPISYLDAYPDFYLRLCLIPYPSR